MRPLAFDGGMRAVNAAKYPGGRLAATAVATCSRTSRSRSCSTTCRTGSWLYGADGLIQYQVFVPHATARAALRAILTRCSRARPVPYLGVLKRHRPDAFLLTHAVDGWSLAMDFPAAAGAASSCGS